MESLLDNQFVIDAAIFFAGLLSAGIVLGAKYLAESFRKSSNKLDDVLIPALERIAAALEEEEE